MTTIAYKIIKKLENTCNSHATKNDGKFLTQMLVNLRKMEESLDMEYCSRVTDEIDSNILETIDNSKDITEIIDNTKAYTKNFWRKLNKYYTAGAMSREEHQYLRSYLNYVDGVIDSYTGGRFNENYKFSANSIIF